MGAKAKDPVAAALPGIAIGCVLYLTGSVVGRKLGPGWTDILQGTAFFVGLALIVVGVRRRQRKRG